MGAGQPEVPPLVVHIDASKVHVIGSQPSVPPSYPRLKHVKPLRSAPSHCSPSPITPSPQPTGEPVLLDPAPVLLLEPPEEEDAEAAEVLELPVSPAVVSAPSVVVPAVVPGVELVPEGSAVVGVGDVGSELDASPWLEDDEESDSNPPGESDPGHAVRTREASNASDEVRIVRSR